MPKNKLKTLFLTLLISLSGISPSFCAKHSGIERAGDAVQIVIPLSALVLAYSKDDTDGVKELLYSVALSTAVTWGLKLAVNSKRPKGGGYSFPSGHTSLAFSGATFLGMRYGMAYGAPAFAGASFVGYSRVYAKRHYWSDILGGALVGSISSYIFTTPYQGHKSQTSKNNESSKDSELSKDIEKSASIPSA